MPELMHKPPLKCQSCTTDCTDTIVHAYITKDGKVIFEYCCMKCGKAGQFWSMDFAQSIAYCISKENTAACFMQQPSLVM